eukprot:5779072-Pleurochrysis_carterae.AAC.1
MAVYTQKIGALGSTPSLLLVAPSSERRGKTRRLRRHRSRCTGQDRQCHLVKGLRCEASKVR